MEQQTLQWRLDRMGKITGSNMGKVLGTRRNQIAYAKKIIEELEAIDSGKAEEYIEKTSFTSAATAWGHKYEPQALAQFALENDIDVLSAGFITHPDYPFMGASVDGLYDGGLVEAKCPYSSSDHIDCFILGMPEKHIPQVRGNMFITQREKATFISFDPRLPPDRRYYQFEMTEDRIYTERMLRACKTFWRDMVVGQNFYWKRAAQ